MTAITRELRKTQKQYYDIGRKNTAFNVVNPREAAKLVFQPNGFPDGLARFA